MFGPNHCPTFLSSELPIKAICRSEKPLLRLSSNMLTIFRYDGSLQVTDDQGVVLSFTRIVFSYLVSEDQRHGRPKCSWTSVCARIICPQRNMQPQPLSVVSCGLPRGVKQRRYVNQRRDSTSERISSNALAGSSYLQPRIHTGLVQCFGMSSGSCPSVPVPKYPSNILFKVARTTLIQDAFWPRSIVCIILQRMIWTR